jgi:hypothetical protein
VVGVLAGSFSGLLWAEYRRKCARDMGVVEDKLPRLLTSSVGGEGYRMSCSDTGLLNRISSSCLPVFYAMLSACVSALRLSRRRGTLTPGPSARFILSVPSDPFYFRGVRRNINTGFLMFEL